MSTLACMGLADTAPFFKTMDTAKTTVLGTFPKQCFSFARAMAETTDGSYVEGYSKLKSVPFLPVWHAWFVSPEGAVTDGTTVEKEAFRSGILVPAATFKEFMSDPAFVKRFEIYGEMPFHRACIDTGKRMTWLR